MEKKKCKFQWLNEALDSRQEGKVNMPETHKGAQVPPKQLWNLAKHIAREAGPMLDKKGLSG